MHICTWMDPRFREGNWVAGGVSFLPLAQPCCLWVFSFLWRGSSLPGLG